MPGTTEAAWRRRTRTPVLLATACVWVAAVELTALDRRTMGGMGAAGMPAGTTARLDLAMVALMVAAMMTPLLICAVRHVAARSLRRRRARRVTMLVAAHALVWLTGGVAIQVVAGRAVTALGADSALVAGVVLALAWHMSPTAQRCASRHHAQPPLAAFGTGADLDVLRYGARHAAYCLGACWPIMLLPALCGVDQLAVMALCSVWVWVLAWESPERPRWRFWLPARLGRLLRGRLASAQESLSRISSRTRPASA